MRNGDNGLKGVEQVSDVPASVLQAEIDADIAVHAALYGPHTKNILETMITGQYMNNACLNHYTYANTVIANNTLYATPFFVARTMTVDKMTFRVIVAEADKSARVGIYNDGTNLYPGTLLVDAGTASLASTGQKEIVISGDQQLTRGWYWLAILSNATGTAEITDRHTTGFNPLGRLITDTRTEHAGWSVAQAYGALPGPFTASGTFVEDEIWDIVLKLKTLD